MTITITIFLPKILPACLVLIGSTTAIALYIIARQDNADLYP